MFGLRLLFRLGYVVLIYLGLYIGLVLSSEYENNNTG